MRRDFDRQWVALSQEVLIGIKEWRRQHPHATLKEIEMAIDERLTVLRAQLITDAALASAATDWEEEAATEQPRCPQCGAKLKPRGVRAERRLQTHGGKRSSWCGSTGSVRPVGRRFFPLDEELGLQAGALSPYLQEQLTRLSVWIPSFARAAELFEVFTGAHVSASGARRQSEAAGAMQVALQEAAGERLRHEPGNEPAGPERLVLSVDGAMVPLVGGEWKECKTLVVGEPRVTPGAQGEPVVKSEHLSYFSRAMDAETFKWQALVETQRRGVATAQAVASVSDGAEWIQGFVDFHRYDAVRILDLPHVGEYVHKVAQAVYGEGTPQAQDWWHTRMQALKERGASSLLAELRGLCEAQPQCSPLSDSLAYLQKRAGQLHYPAYQAAGWPLGSGIVESANKLLVEDRLKGSGMHWAPEHVNPLLALRNIVFNNRWDEAWPQIARGLRAKALQHRFEGQQKRRAQKTPPQEPVPPPETKAHVCSPPVASGRQQARATPSDVDPRERYRPGPNHPWRHSTVGKARYQPWRPDEPPKT
jgi:hypothetical protein